MRKIVLIASVLAALGSAQADDLDYTYVEAGFSQVDIDGVNEDGDALFIGGSYGIGENWLAFGEYSTAEFDAGAGASDDRNFSLSTHFDFSFVFFINDCRLQD